MMGRGVLCLCKGVAPRACLAKDKIEGFAQVVLCETRCIRIMSNQHRLQDQLLESAQVAFCCQMQELRQRTILDNADIKDR